MIHSPVSVEDCLQHTPFIRRLASSLVGETDADDLVQEALLTAMQRPPRERAAVRGWLARVVRNLAHNRVLSDHRRRHREQRGLEARSAPPTCETVERDAVRQHLGDALDRLSEDQRQVLLLRFYEDQPPRAIAALLDLPVETVRSRQKRGLACLRESLDQDFGDDRRAWGVALVALGGPVRHSRTGLLPGLVTAAALLAALTACLLYRLAETPREPISVAQTEIIMPRDEAPITGALPKHEVNRVVSVAEPTEVPITMDSQARRLVFEIVDASGAPVEASIYFCEGNSSYVPVISTGATGLAELVVSEDYLGQLGNPGWEEVLALTVMAVGRQRSAIRVVDPIEGEVTHIRIVLGPATAVSLAGIVIDSNGQPVEGADVTVGNPGITLTTLSDGSLDVWMPDTNKTGEDGRFEFEGLAPGRRPILAEAEGFSGCWIQCDLPVQQDLVLRIDRGARLTGTVRTELGDAVPGALVHCAWDDMLYGHQSVPSAEAVANARGEFALEGVGRDRLLLWAEHPEKPDHVAHTVLERGEKLHWNAILRQSQGIHLSIEDAQGRTVEGAHALLMTTPGTPKWRGSAYSGEDGVISLFCLPDTPLNVSVTAEAYTSDWPATLSGVVPSDEVHVIRLLEEPPELVTFRGLVTSSEGVPLPGCTRISMRQGAVVWRHFEVDAVGEFAGMLPTGEYEISAVSDLLGCTNLVTTYLANEHDLGPLMAPPLGRLSYVGDWSAGFGYELVQKQLKSGSPTNLRIAGGIGPPPPHWDLFPGRYELHIYDTAFLPVERFDVSLAAGRGESVGARHRPEAPEEGARSPTSK